MYLKSLLTFLKTRKDRILLSQKVHPFLMTRGVPGTHDINIMLNFFQNLKRKKFQKFKLPKFNKAVDDRFKKRLWYSINKRPDVVIFEGWCVGARAEKNQTLKKPINIFEKNNDTKLKWRLYVNKQLKLKYKKLFTQLDCLLFLKAANFGLLKQWRLKQEEKLKLINDKNSKKLRIMSKKDILKFMLTYQRITQNMFKFAPKYSSMIANLNRNHQITKVIYNKK